MATNNTPGVLAFTKKRAATEAMVCSAWFACGGDIVHGRIARTDSSIGGQRRSLDYNNDRRASVLNAIYSK
jgi:hypothetical protein